MLKSTALCIVNCSQKWNQLKYNSKYYLLKIVLYIIIVKLTTTSISVRARRNDLKSLLQCIK